MANFLANHKAATYDPKTQQWLEQYDSNQPGVGGSTILELLSRGVWSKIPGNSIQYTWYTGVEAGNPSGNKDNIKSVAYLANSTLIVTETFTWSNATGQDGEDQVLTCVAS